ncbi:MAG: hybrid sensor histidine kinase/response regulator [Sandaracinaceae bacterium]
MVPQSLDLIAWIANELSLTQLRVGTDGSVEVLVGTVPRAGERAEVRLAALTGADENWLSQVLEDVRSGHPAALELPGEDEEGETTSRLLAWKEGDDVRVLFAPKVSPAALARRAAAADHAAGVTHEVANSLTAIAGWTRMASTGAPLPERTRQALEVVQRSAREALDTARGLLRTMRDSSAMIEASPPDRTDSAAVVREVLETLRPEVEMRGVTLTLALADDVWGAAPPAALRLIVSNLVRNALEAMDGGGRIAVTVQPDGDRFTLVVEDDGPGMSRETLERAFERYFTTKDSGTGLGLAMVRDTVHEAGGQVEVESQRGRGTCFEVTLPLAGAARLSLRPPKVTDGSPLSSGVHVRPLLAGRTILVVDDDQDLRLLVRTALELHGARVLAAGTRAEALAADAGRSFDVAIVDLSLGEDRGDALLAELVRLGRARETILMTGSTEDDLSFVPSALLRKPFELADLHRAIEDVGAGPAPAGEASSS